MKACFVTDGGREVGLGHVFQSTTVAREFQPKAEIRFLTKSDEIVATLIRSSGFDVERLEDDHAIFRALAATDPDVVLFDKIDVQESLAKGIKDKLRSVLVLFTNLTTANRHADIVVTAGVGSDLQNVSYIDAETNTAYYYGPKYWVLRPGFREYHNRRKPQPKHTARIVLIFGGSDPSALTPLVLRTLFEMERKFSIDVVLGAHFSSDRELSNVLDRHPDKAAGVSIHRNTTHIPEIMFNADLTITAPGLATFESLVVGTPVLLVPQNDMQRTYRRFMRMVDPADINELKGMISRGEFTYPQDENVARMQIGDGISEIMQAVMTRVERR